MIPHDKKNASCCMNGLLHFCSIRFLLIFSTVFSLLFMAVVMSVVNYALSDYAQSTSHILKDHIILQHVKKVSFDYLRHISHLPFEYRDRMSHWHGTIDMLDSAYMDYSTEQAVGLLDYMTYGGRLRIVQADIAGNTYIYNRTPKKLELRFGNSSEQIVDHTISDSSFGPMWVTPIVRNETSNPPYGTAMLNRSATRLYKPDFALSNLAWYAAGMNETNGPDDSVTVETLCVCTYLYLWTAVRNYNSDGEFVGIIGATVAVAEVSVFLQDLGLEDETVVLINRDTHHLLASNRPEEIETTYTDETTGKLKLRDARESSNEVLGEIYSTAMRLTDEFSRPVNEVLVDPIVVRGHIVNFNEFAMNNVPILSVVMIPTSTVYSLSYVMSGVGSAIAFVVFILAGMMSTILAFLIIRPLRTIMGHLELIQNMDLESVNEIHHTRSSLLEVRKIQESLWFLLEKLMFYRAFLPAEFVEDVQERKKSLSSHSNSIAGSENEMKSASDHTEGLRFSSTEDTITDCDQTSESNGSEVTITASIQEGYDKTSSIHSSESHPLHDAQYRAGEVVTHLVSIACIRIQQGVGDAEDNAQAMHPSERSRVNQVVRRRLRAVSHFLENLDSSAPIAMYRGRILHFTEDGEVFVAWNMRKSSQLTHSKLAARFAVQLMKSHKEEGDLSQVQLHVGLARGWLTVGTVGTSLTKKRVFGGPCYSTARVLAKVSENFDIPILVEESLNRRLVESNMRESSDNGLHRFVSTQFDLMYHGEMDFEQDLKPIRIFHLQLTEQARCTEWLYLQPIEEELSRSRNVERAFNKTLSTEILTEDDSSNDDAGDDHQFNPMSLRTLGLLAELRKKIVQMLGEEEEKGSGNESSSLSDLEDADRVNLVRKFVGRKWAERRSNDQFLLVLRNAFY